MGLLEITKLPTAENAVIHLHPSDNIAIARVALSPGQQLRVEGSIITVEDPIPAGHKVALKPVGSGEHIVRYATGAVKTVVRRKREIASSSSIGPAFSSRSVAAPT